MAGRTCPTLMAAWIVADATIVASGEALNLLTDEELAERGACRTDCEHYSSTIPTGEGFATGCRLEHPAHFKA